jgi:hypothetical protein
MEKKHIYITIAVVVIIAGYFYFKNKKNKKNEVKSKPKEPTPEEIQQNFDKMIMQPPEMLEQIRKDVLEDKQKYDSLKMIVDRASELKAPWAEEEKKQSWYNNMPTFETKTNNEQNEETKV